MPAEITVSLGSSLVYYGHFLDAIRRRYVARVRFRADMGFGRISPKGGLAVVTPDGLRLFFFADDMADQWNEAALEWCDAYGTVNADLGRWPVPAHAQKVVVLGPSFGFRSLSQLDILRYVAATGVRRRDRPKFIAGTARQEIRFHRTRPSLAAYPRSDPRIGYVYHLGKFWANHPDANAVRQVFLEECAQSSIVDLDGGFVFEDRSLSVKNIQRISHLAADRVSTSQYLRQMAESSFAFSSPAVHGCLGWKLGEFFAMGKAIMTPPLGRDLPAPLVHGEHVYFVSPERKAIRDAVERLSHDQELIKTLQHGADSYWRDYLHPKRQIERMIAAAESSGT